MTDIHSGVSGPDDLADKVGQLSVNDEPTRDPNAGPSSMSEELIALGRDVSQILNHVYEVQELRHMRRSAALDGGQAPDTQLNDRITALKDDMTRLSRALANVSIRDGELGSEVSNLYAELQGDWARAKEEYAGLDAETKEDGWLQRFRDTAGQAEGMLSALQQSWQSCSAYVDQVLGSPAHIPFDSNLEQQPSLRKLQELVKSHEAMRVTYMPSIVKTLKLMDRSITDRPVKNGEALRRYSDTARLWQILQKNLRELEGRIRLVLSHRSPSGSLQGSSDYEDLMSEKPPFASSAISDDSCNHFTDGQSPPFAPSHSQRSSSWSSNGASGSLQAAILPPTHTAAGESNGHPAPGKKRLSMLPGPSGGPGSYGSPAFRSVSAAASAQPSDPMRTPTARRFVSQALPVRAGAASPSPGHSSGMSSARPAASGSRIPMLSPSRSTAPPFPGPSAHAARAPSAASARTDMLPPRQTFGSPAPAPRTRTISGLSSRGAGAPSTPSSRMSDIGLPPRGSSAPRQSLGRAPPSSYRGATPTPTPSSFRSPGPRPSSRMSVGSRAASVIAPASLAPFHPSKYDLLDQHVARIVAEEGFNLFVSRIDTSLQKTQRKRDDEEWKGEYVFGAGQKTSSVKLLKLAGRPRLGDDGPRVKVMARTGGQWVDLPLLLRTRLEEVETDEVF